MDTLSVRDQGVIARLGLGDVVREHQFIPRDEVVQRQRAAQVLLHFRWADPGEEGILTGSCSSTSPPVAPS
jgi:hypothetical protein